MNTKIRRFNTTVVDITPVIFRWFENDVIAIFPEEVGTNQPHTCMSYMHLGQHGSCNPDYVIANSKPIDFNNVEQSYLYRCLYEELESIGYNLKEYSRYTKHHYDKRKFTLQQLKHLS